MNETLSRLKQFLKRPFFTDPRTLLWLWLLLALGSALIKFHKCNNFLIFKYVFYDAKSVFVRISEKNIACFHLF